MAGACDGLGGHRKQLVRGARRRARRGPAAAAGTGGGPGVALRRGDGARGRGGDGLPDIPPWTEAERLVKEKEVLGFFISGHPLERFRDGGGAVRHPHHRHAGRVERAPGDGRGRRHRRSSGRSRRRRARSTPGWCWRTSTAPRRRSSSPTPGPSSTGRSCPDAALLLTGGYSDRDRGEDHAPFIVESARALEELKALGRGGAEPPLAGTRPRPARTRSGRRRRSAPPTRAPRPCILNGATGTGSRCGSGPVASASRRRTTSFGPCAISWAPIPSTTSKRADPDGLSVFAGVREAAARAGAADRGPEADRHRAADRHRGRARGPPGQARNAAGGDLPEPHPHPAGHGRPPSPPPLYAGLPEHHLHRLHRTPRRPPLHGRPRDRRRLGAARAASR